MKKIICFVMVLVLLVGICSCTVKKDPNDNSIEISTTNEPEDNSIELTMDNYNTYLNVDLKVYNSSDSKQIIKYKIDVNGASTNFNYIDVKLNVLLKGDVICGEETIQVEHLFNVNTDIGGNFSSSSSPKAASIDVDYNGSTLDDLDKSFDSMDCDIELISVSGKVVPV